MLTPPGPAPITPLRTATDVVRALRAPRPGQGRLARLLAEVWQLRQARAPADSALAAWAQEFAALSQPLSLQGQILWWGRARGMTDEELQTVLAVSDEDYQRLSAQVAEAVGGAHT